MCCLYGCSTSEGVINMGLKIEVDIDVPIVELIDKHIPFIGNTREEVIANMTKSWLLEKHGIHTLREMLGLEPLIKILKLEE